MTTLRYTDVQPEQELISATIWKLVGQAAGNWEGQSGLPVKSSVPAKVPEWSLGEPELHDGDWFQASISGCKLRWHDCGL